MIHTLRADLSRELAEVKACVADLSRDLGEVKGRVAELSDMLKRHAHKD